MIPDADTPDAEDCTPLNDQTLLLEVVRALVDEPSKVSVEEKRSATASIFIIRVDPKDRGKVIGKHGSTVALLRNLFSRVAAAEGRRILIEIFDDRKGDVSEA